MSIAEHGLVGEDWGGDMGRNWLANLQKFEGMIQPIGAALLTHAAFRPGERVIDIGCGGGGTTISIGRSVSPGGHATGLDISKDLVEAANVRASMGTQSDVRFVCADAATASVTGAPFDRLFSRFGSMFFPDAKAGFRNLRRMVRDGGRIDLAVWAPPKDNEWISLVQATLAPLVPAPDSPPDPRAPGPFALADTDWLTQVLEQAGFGDIAITPCQRAQPIGGPGASAEDAARFIVAATHVVRQLPEAAQEKAIAALTEAFAPHHVPGKGVLLDGKAWLVTATAR